MQTLYCQPSIISRLASLPRFRQQLLAPLRCALKASADSQADPTPPPRKRKSKAKPEEVTDVQSVQQAQEPEVKLDCGIPVLPQAAIAILSMIRDHGYGNVRDIMVDRHIKGVTILKHLLTLLDLEELDMKTLLKIHDLEQGPPASLTQEIIEQALPHAKSKVGVTKEDALFSLLAQQQRDAVEAQEIRHPGITLMQLALVKQLQKRKSSQGNGDAGAGAADVAQGSWADQLPLLLKSADRKRLGGYLQGKTLLEIQQPPYSRTQVSTQTAYDTLVAAVKAGVKLPRDRVLQDFKLDAGGAGLSTSEVAVAISHILDKLTQGIQGMPFYEATRTKLLEDPTIKHKVESQESLDPMGRKLTAQQARLVYYMVTGGELDKPAEWVEQEKKFAAMMESLQ